MVFEVLKFNQRTLSGTKVLVKSDTLCPNSCFYPYVKISILDK